MSISITISLSPDDFREIRQNASNLQRTLPAGAVQAVVGAVTTLDSKLNEGGTNNLRSRDSTASGREDGSHQQRGQLCWRKIDHYGDDDDYKDGMRVSKKRQRSSVDGHDEEENKRKSRNRGRDDKYEDSARKAAKAAIWEKRQRFLAYREHGDSGRLFVRTEDGKYHTYRAPPSATIGEVMGMISRKTGIHPESQRLVFAGRELAPRADDYHWQERAQRTLRSLGVPREATVHMVLRLAGS